MSRFLTYIAALHFIEKIASTFAKMHLLNFLFIQKFKVCQCKIHSNTTSLSSSAFVKTAVSKARVVTFVIAERCFFQILYFFIPIPIKWKSLRCYSIRRFFSEIYVAKYFGNLFRITKKYLGQDIPWYMMTAIHFILLIS